MNKIEHNSMPRVTDVCAEDAEVLALSITRAIASGYITGDVACWDLAYTGAERVLGPEKGAHLVGCLISLMRAIRAERAADWSFMPATCCRVTAHEEALIRLIALARHGDRHAVTLGAARLTGVAVAPRTAAAVCLAAMALDGVAASLSPTSPEKLSGTAVLH